MKLYTADERHAWMDRYRDVRWPASGWQAANGWQAASQVGRAWAAETIRRIERDPTPYLQGLVIVMGSRGAEPRGVVTGCWHVNGHGQVSAPGWYERAVDRPDEWEAMYQKYNTDDTRQNLHTLLSALAEIPQSWAMSAFKRFLRGIGKQKGAKYTGAGMFDRNSGWKAREVEGVARLLADSRGTMFGALWPADPLNYYDPDYDPYGALGGEIEDEGGDRWAATRVERNKPFIDKLCKMLEAK